ncbi:hypothetical protein M218_06760 [Burkholderia pseudomallei MSHR338]|nr:hypothetical protein M218_06760 [Burkholderia pseudomallei MSHR338]
MHACVRTRRALECRAEATRAAPPSPREGTR